MVALVQVVEVNPWVKEPYHSVTSKDSYPAALGDESNHHGSYNIDAQKHKLQVSYSKKVNQCF